jgi:hypothetical protein
MGFSGWESWPAMMVGLSLTASGARNQANFITFWVRRAAAYGQPVSPHQFNVIAIPTS